MRAAFSPRRLSGAAGFAAIVAAFSYPVPAAGHDWLRGYKTPGGAGCCNETDCRPLARGMTVRLGDRVVVFEGDRPTEITVIHPSADELGRTWICRTGCAFLPGMS